MDITVASERRTLMAYTVSKQAPCEYVIDGTID